MRTSYAATAALIAGLVCVGVHAAAQAASDAELIEARARVTEYNQQLRRIDAAVEKAQNELREAQRELVSLRKQMAGKTGKDAQQLRQRLERTQAEVNRREKELQSFSSKRAQALEQVAKAEKRVAAIQKELAAKPPAVLQGSSNSSGTTVIGGNSTTITGPGRISSGSSSAQSSSSSSQQSSSSGNQAIGGNASTIDTSKGGTVVTEPPAKTVTSLASAGILHPSLAQGVSISDRRAVERLSRARTSASGTSGTASRIVPGSVGATESVSGPIIVPGTAEAGRPQAPAFSPSGPVTVATVSRDTYVPEAPAPGGRVGQSGGKPVQSAPVYLRTAAVPTSEVRLSRVFYRNGFPEVGLLAERDEPFCSAVLLHEEWVLTAAHCLAEPDAAGSSRFRYNDLRDIAVFLAKPSISYAYVVDDQGRRMLHRPALRELPVVGYVIHHGWKGVEEYDLALVRVRPAEPLNRSDLPQLTPEPLRSRVEITMAGYGNTASTAGATGGMLEVGWQVSDFEAGGSGTFQWFYGDGSDSPAASSTCLMDSGGPVYQGVQQGYLGETRTLVGIIAGFRHPSASAWRWSRATPCRGGQALNVRVDREDVRAWVCKASSNSVRGC